MFFAEKPETTSDFKTANQLKKQPIKKQIADIEFLSELSDSQLEVIVGGMNPIYKGPGMGGTNPLYKPW